MGMFRYRVWLVATLWLVAPPVAILPPARATTLFHVSFDTQADMSTWPLAEVAAGEAGALNQGGLLLEADGPFGDAVRWQPPGSVLGYDTAHNLRSEQGTIAFWLNLGANAVTE